MFLFLVAGCNLQTEYATNSYRIMENQCYVKDKNKSYMDIQLKLFKHLIISLEIALEVVYIQNAFIFENLYNKPVTRQSQKVPGSIDF